MTIKSWFSLLFLPRWERQVRGPSAATAFNNRNGLLSLVVSLRCTSLFFRAIPRGGCAGTFEGKGWNVKRGGTVGNAAAAQGKRGVHHHGWKGPEASELAFLLSVQKSQLSFSSCLCSTSLTLGSKICSVLPSNSSSTTQTPTHILLFFMLAYWFRLQCSPFERCASRSPFLLLKRKEWLKLACLLI